MNPIFAPQNKNHFKLNTFYGIIAIGDVFCMANKGQKFNQYTPELRNEIVSKFLNENKRFGYLSNEYGISKGTIKG